MSTASQTFWGKTKSGGKLGFDKIYSLVDKLGAPVNKLSNKLGSEAFWPTSLDKESDKAARILRSFCKDGFYKEEEQQASPISPQIKQKVLKKIPAEVIKNAQGLAIFTTMRTGLWMSGSGGSGVLVARKADGNWSSPSGILIHTAGLGFLVGVDIYDCVLVINTQKALEAFTRIRATVGGELSATVGPAGAGGILDSELHKRQAPIFSYIKSRGFYAGVQIDGTVVVERNDENEKFYGEKITAQDILKGKARHPPLECRGLFETLKAAEGSTDVDNSLLPSQPPPSDFEIVSDDHQFGVPDKDDPDPYGVLQLEKEGMLIREAGTHERASWEQFTFSPAVTSPLYDTFEKRGSANISRRGSWLSTKHKRGGSKSSIDGAVMSEARSVKDAPLSPVSMSDMATQTDDLPPPPSPGRKSLRNSVQHPVRPSMDDVPEHEVIPPSSQSAHSRSPSYTGRRRSMRSLVSQTSTPPTKASMSEDEPHLDGGAASASEGHDADAEDTLEDEEDEEPVVVEQPIVHAVQKAPAAQVLQKARVVNVPKRGPPPILPPRNPNRHSGPHVVTGDRPGSPLRDVSPAPKSPILADESAPSSSVTARRTSPIGRREEGLGISSTLADSNTERDDDAPSEYPSLGPTPDETPDSERDPWNGVLAQHGSVNASEASLDLPGAFHSLPTTPGEPGDAAHGKAS